MDHLSQAYFSTDPDKMIESDQQLFLDDIPDLKNTISTTAMKACDKYNHHHGSNDPLIEYACNVKGIDEDDSFIANFLTDALLLNHEDDDTMFDIA